MSLERIAKIIKEKRKEKGFTQDELASKINVTEKAVSRWETGRGTPDISLLIPLSEVLGISVSELLNGKVDKKEDNNIKEIINYIDESKNKKNKMFIAIASIMYVIFLIIYLWYLKIEYDTGNGIHIRYYEELIYNFIFIMSIFFLNRLVSNNYYDKIEDRKRMNKISYVIILVIYLIMFFNLTIFGRDASILNSYNLVPFKTILNYWRFPSMYNTLVNIIGNIVILVPVQFLVMKIFDIKKFSTNFVISIFLSLTVEIIQFITKTGIFDIDDIILNVFGMSLMYGLVMGKHKLLVKYKELIISSTFSLVIVFILFEILNWYHFGNIPTFIVLLRLIIVFLIIETIVYFVYKKRFTK